MITIETLDNETELDLQALTEVRGGQTNVFSLGTSGIDTSSDTLQSTTLTDGSTYWGKIVRNRCESVVRDSR